MTAAVRKVRVVAALIPHPSDPSRFLVQQRPPGKSRALLWEFPGGKVEAGETDEQALVREGEEELEVELVVGARLWSTEHVYPDLHVELVLLAAEISEGEPKPLMAHRLEWATFAEMAKLPFCEADVPLLEKLVDGSLDVRGAFSTER